MRGIGSLSNSISRLRDAKRREKKSLATVGRDTTREEIVSTWTIRSISSILLLHLALRLVFDYSCESMVEFKRIDRSDKSDLATEVNYL